MYHPFNIQQEKEMAGANLLCFLPLIKTDLTVNSLFVLQMEKFYSLLLIWKEDQEGLIFGMQTFKLMAQRVIQLMQVKLILKMMSRRHSIIVQVETLFFLQMECREWADLTFLLQR